MKRQRLRQLFDMLLEYHGPQGWWPADTDIETSLGAILVQNTNWTNAVLAIGQLRNKTLLDQAAILACPQDLLEEHIRSSGCFRQKAARLRTFCRWLVDYGGFDGLQRRATAELRESLLGLNGIGPETADCILLYAFRRPVFVADGYARRIFQRLGMTAEIRAAAYERIRLSMEEETDMDTRTFGEFHALLVAHGKNVCKQHPDCKSCVLSQDCNFHYSKHDGTGPTEHQN